jgi:hypothetical protein
MERERRLCSGWLAGWVGYPLAMRSGAAFCPQAPKIEAYINICTGREICEQLFDRSLSVLNTPSEFSDPQADLAFRPFSCTSLGKSV